MPAKRQGKAVLIPSSPAYSFGSSKRPKPLSGDTPGPGTYNIHGEAPHAPPRGSNTPARAQTMARGNVLGCTTAQPLSYNRSSPSHNIAGKPLLSRLWTRTPGPGDYHDSRVPVNPKHPAYTFRGSSVSGLHAGSPGPGTYNWGHSLDKLRPNAAEPVSMKFRHAEPGDKTSRPGPAEYSPKDRLAIYKGEYAKCSMKFRNEHIDTDPEPGPGEYYPTFASRKRAPNHTIRLKLARDLCPPPYPGPGSYDVDSSTIGNWGAGMAAHIPEGRDIFCQIPVSPDHTPFLEQKCKTQMEMRRVELVYGTTEECRKKAAGKLGRSKNGGKSQARNLSAANGQAPGNGFLVEQHLYDTN